VPNVARDVGEVDAFLGVEGRYDSSPADVCSESLRI
jgi:hypothetical protein